MIRVLIKNWRLIALRGALALLFSAVAFGVQPLSRSFLMRPIVHAGLVVLCGILTMTAGLCTVVAAARGAGQDRFHLLLLDGIAISVIGATILLVPWLNLTALVILLAVWSLVSGVLEFLAALRLRRHISDEWSLALAGTTSVGLGTYFLYVRPHHESSLFRWLALYSFLNGLTVLVLALRLRGLGNESHALAEHAGSSSSD